MICVCIIQYLPVLQSNSDGEQFYISFPFESESNFFYVELILFLFCSYKMIFDFNLDAIYYFVVFSARVEDFRR